MENNNEDTVFCDSCKKDIAKSNFALHEPHCRRFLCLCPDCDEPVPREQLEDHRTEQHKQVNCPKCKIKVERCRLMDHELGECKERLVSCEYCQLELPLCTLADHTEMCGSRTERCLDCGRYVTLKDQLQHADTCPSSTVTNSTGHEQKTSGQDTNKSALILCWKCNKSFQSQYLEEHLLNCASSTPAEAQEEVREEEEEEEEEEDSHAVLRLSDVLAGRRKGQLDQISTCPICHLALPLETLHWHEKKCRIFASLKCAN